ncbi:MAG: hypothetical protein QW703_00315 [Candidatus Aenigmatarchaeota archaeon]
MKRNLYKWLAGLGLAMSLYTGCATKQYEIENQASQYEQYKAQEPTKPYWIENPPENCGVGVAYKTQNPGFDAQIADARARTDLAKRICGITECNLGITMVEDRYADDEKIYSLVCKR